MDVNFRPIFPTPMGYANFGEQARELNKQLVKDIDDCMSKHTGKDRTFRKNNSGWQSNPYLEDMYESFERLRGLIDAAAKPVLGHSGVTDETLPQIRTEGLWANVCFDVGGYSRPHIHGAGRTLWSGVYYPQSLHDEITNDNLDEFEEHTTIMPGFQKGDGLLVLLDPSKTTKGLLLTQFNSREFYGGEVSVFPRESLLILFPVWVMHMVTPLTKKEKRYSISFSIQKPT